MRLTLIGLLPDSVRSFLTSATMSVTLLSGDDKTFVVDLKAAKRSVLIQNLLEDHADASGDQNDIPIPLMNVKADTLAKVILFCEHHKDDIVVPPEEPSSASTSPPAAVDSKDSKDSRDNIKSEWDNTFVAALSKEELFEVILAANYLDITPLLDLGCETVANMIKGRSVEDIRTEFGIENDFTPEEEEAIRKENEWLTEA